MNQKIIRKNLAFDFDDVVCNTVRAFLAFHKEKYGRTVPYASVGTKLYKNLGISKKTEDNRWDEFFKDPKFCYPAPTKDLAKNLRLMKKKYRLLLLSARDYRWQYQIKAWIKKYLPDIFAQIIFIDNGRTKKSKGSVCRRNKTVALIEDEPEHIKSCLTFHAPVIVFDRPWNRNIKKSIPRIRTLARLKKVLPPLN